MATPTLAGEILDQHDRAFQMLRELVLEIDPSQWKEGVAPARWAYHAVQGAAFYLCDQPNQFDGSKVVDWEGPVENLPDQKTLVALADETLKRMHERWEARTDDEMLAATDYPWTGQSRMSQLMYNLRHLTYHIGEISMFLRERGAAQTPWH